MRLLYIYIHGECTHIIYSTVHISTIYELYAEYKLYAHYHNNNNNNKYIYVCILYNNNYKYDYKCSTTLKYIYTYVYYIITIINMITSVVTNST